MYLRVQTRYLIVVGGAYSFFRLAVFVECVYSNLYPIRPTIYHLFGYLYRLCCHACMHVPPTKRTETRKIVLLKSLIFYTYYRAAVWVPGASSFPGLFVAMHACMYRSKPTARTGTRKSSSLQFGPSHYILLIRPRPREMSVCKPTSRAAVPPTARNGAAGTGSREVASRGGDGRPTAG